MVPPIWLDATGRRQPTEACWTCGREVPGRQRFQAADLRPHGWGTGAHPVHPRVVRLPHRVPSAPRRPGLVAARPDLGPGGNAEPIAAVRAGRSRLGALRTRVAPGPLRRRPAPAGAASRSVNERTAGRMPPTRGAAPVPGSTARGSFADVRRGPGLRRDSRMERSRGAIDDPSPRGRSSAGTHHGAAFSATTV